jgi:hypothetical protein
MGQQPLTKMITLDTLQAMFDNIRTNTKWPIEGPMLWGYFFTDGSAEKLRSLVPVLEVQGYRYVDLFVPELDEGEDEYFFLHMEKEEAHTLDSLHERNQQLYALADLHGLASYDGMDVGPITTGTTQ